MLSQASIGTRGVDILFGNQVSIYYVRLMILHDDLPLDVRMSDWTTDLMSVNDGHTEERCTVYLLIY